MAFNGCLRQQYAQERGIGRYHEAPQSHRITPREVRQDPRGISEHLVPVVIDE
jgi:hypothetical protein